MHTLAPSFMELGSFEATETYGHAAIKRVVRTLPLFEQAYARVRFSIMRPQLLTVMDLVLPSEGRILDVGCGFGLFAGYFGLTAPRRCITGVDPNARRIGIARHVATQLGLHQHDFIDGVAEDPRVVGPFQGIYVLDVMHHVAREAQRALITRLRDLLAPNGILIIKDVTTEPYFGLKFTEVLDRLVVGFKEPLAYRHHREWGQLLSELGFAGRVVRVPDILPYPHVVIIAHKT